MWVHAVLHAVCKTSLKVMEIWSTTWRSKMYTVFTIMHAGHQLAHCSTHAAAVVDLMGAVADLAAVDSTAAAD